MGRAASGNLPSLESTGMAQSPLDQMSMQEIMSRWPATIRVFVAWHLHCVGCPVADFHRLADAAREHGVDVAALRRAVEAVIEAAPTASEREF
jgi:hybrid cluster-associated redox disulfide protein